MGAGKAFAQARRLFDREHRLMLDRRRCNTERGEACIEGVAVSCHGLSVALSRGGGGHPGGDQLDRRNPIACWIRGCSSGVEHNLAKVGVGGSNPLARSNFLP